MNYIRKKQIIEEISMKMSLAEIAKAIRVQNDIAKAFCEILEANKFFCGVYSGASHLNHNFDDYVKEKFTIWDRCRTRTRFN